MGIQLLKDNQNRGIVDLQGRRLSTRPVNQQLLQNGLIGEFDADNVVNVGGYSQTALNYVVGGINCVQNTAINQMAIVQNYLNGKAAFHDDSYSATEKFVQATSPFSGIQDIFFVIATTGSLVSFTEYADDMATFGIYNGILFCNFNSDQGISSIFNNKIYSNGKYTGGGGYAIGTRTASFSPHSFSYFGFLPTGYGLGSSNGYYMMAWSVYNRQLSFLEKTYNMAVYSSRYGITLEA